LEKSSKSKAATLELMELENIVANTVYLKAREGEFDDFLNFESKVMQLFSPFR
jgi:hypothetical protein